MQSVLFASQSSRLSMKRDLRDPGLCLTSLLTGDTRVLTFGPLGRRSAHLKLLKRGYALFMPNPHGSTGRGREFVRLVVGDMGGADAEDLLAGIDHPVSAGTADSKRLGVSGLSYGGYMTCWLITQIPRCTAAEAVSPITNQVTEHLLSNVGPWVSWFLGDHYRNPAGGYFERSPIMYAHRAKTRCSSSVGRSTGVRSGHLPRGGPRCTQGASST